MATTPYEHQEGRGTLFKDLEREPSSNKPILSGSCKINGVIKDIAIWEAVSKAGNKYYNLKISEQYDKDVQEHPLGAGFAHKDHKKNKSDDVEAVPKESGDADLFNEDDIPF